MKERALVEFDIHEVSIVRVGAYNETQAYARAFEELKGDLIKNSDQYIYNKNKIKVCNIE